MLQKQCFNSKFFTADLNPFPFKQRTSELNLLKSFSLMESFLVFNNLK